MTPLGFAGSNPVGRRKQRVNLDVEIHDSKSDSFVTRMDFCWKGMQSLMNLNGFVISCP